MKFPGYMFHRAKFYKSEYMSSGDGTGENKYRQTIILFCSVKDITALLQKEAKQEVVKKTLKIFTHFTNAITADLFVRLDNEDTVYKIINVENKDGLNRELVITLECL